MALIEVGKGGSILNKYNLRPPVLTLPDEIASIIMTTRKQFF